MPVLIDRGSNPWRPPSPGTIEVGLLNNMPDAALEATERQFAALLMDHEGRYGVHVKIDGPLGTADVESQADATYDLRPRPILTLVFVAPFLLVGFVWGKLLITRTMTARGRGGR